MALAGPARTVHRSTAGTRTSRTTTGQAVHATRVSAAVASLTAPAPVTPVPAPTATLLVATDPARAADADGEPGESLLLGAEPVPVVAATSAPVAVAPALEPVAWVQEAATWGAPLLVGGALLLALTGPSWLRRLRRRRELV